MDYDFHREEFDGLFLSNGPGDPKMCGTTIENIKKSIFGCKTGIRDLSGKPVDGACFRSRYL